MPMSATARVVTLAVAALGTTAIVVGVGGGGVVLVVAAFVAGLVLTQRRPLALVAGDRAPLRHALTQTWWAPIAAILGVALVAAGIGTVFEAHNLGGRIVGSTLLVAFGAAMLLGLSRRPHARETGNALILIGTIPAFPFFWLIVPTLAALVIWIGVLTSGYADNPNAPAPT
jgi:hypothetical protein